MEGKKQAECIKNESKKKLSSALVAAIRDDRRSGVAIAKSFGISPTTVSQIRNYKTWVPSGLERPKKKSLKELFDARLRITPGCWLWHGSKDSHGYGKFSAGGKTLKAYRLAYELYVEPIPSGMHCLHKCDNPICVNPDHLFLGTHQDNMRDKTRKGRARGAHQGEGHYKAKLTDEKVLRIRSDVRTMTEIAKDYGVNRKTIADVLNRKSWVNV